MECNEALHLSCFEIISQVGMARSCFVEAIDLACDGDFEAARAKAEEGEAFFTAAHGVHTALVTQAAQGEAVPADILLIHAEDQLMSGEDFKILAERLIRLAERAGVAA